MITLKLIADHCIGYKSRDVQPRALNSASPSAVLEPYHPERSSQEDEEGICDPCDNHTVQLSTTDSILLEDDSDTELYYGNVNFV